MRQAFLTILCVGLSAACTPGQYASVVGGTICFACPAGTYCPLSQGCAPNCNQCPPNSGSMAGASTCIGPFCQTCPPGYYCGGGLSIQVLLPHSLSLRR
jgi:hypothetical protein